MTQLRLDSTPDRDRGDQEKYSRLELTQLWTYVYRLARSLGLRWPEAEDLAQAVLLKFWLQSHSVEKPRAWLRTVVRRGVHKMLNEPMVISLEEALEPRADHRVEIQSHILAQELLESLPKRQRAALVLSLMGLSQAEIAARLGTSSKSVERVVARARSALRRRSNSH